MPGSDAQKRSELTSDDAARLERQRSFVQSYPGDDASGQKFQTAAEKLGLLRALLEARAFRPDQTSELQSMGVVLGDALVQELGFRWIVLEDEYGRNPAVAVPGMSVLLFPLTMISKRVEEGKAVDIFDLFNWAAARARDLK
jgi:hypothetical protein